MKLDKPLCCMFLFSFLTLTVLKTQPIEVFWVCNSCIVHECKTKDCAFGYGASNINLVIVVCSFDVCHNHSPLLTTLTVTGTVYRLPCNTLYLSLLGCVKMLC